MQSLELNLVNELPDNNWSIILQKEILNLSDVNEVSDIWQCIELLLNNNISYISHFSEHTIGIKYPKYKNELMILVKDNDLEYVQNLLIKNELLFNKTIDEVEEFKDINIEEPVGNELSDADLPFINRFINKAFSTASIFAFVVLEILFVWLILNFSSTEDKIGMSILAALLNLLFVSILLNSYKK